MSSSAEQPFGDGENSGGARPLRALLRALEWTSKAVVVIATIVVLGFTVAQVPDRYIFKSNFDAYDQFARMGLVWLTFSGFAMGVRARVNIRIELLSHFIPERLSRFAASTLDLVMLAVSVVILVAGWRLLEVGSYQIILGTPFTYRIMYLGMLVGIAAVAIFVGARVLNTITGQRFKIDRADANADR